MPTDIQIVNNALRKLGEQPISSLSGTSETEKIAGDSYTYIRDALLSEFPWNFATRRTAINAFASAPVWGFARKYALPTDLLRLIEVENNFDHPYKVEDGWILTDLESPINIKYVYTIQETQMTPAFVEALSSRLAFEWARPLSQTSTVVSEMFELYKNKLRVARAFDSQTETQESLDFPTFIDARF